MLSLRRRLRVLSLVVVAALAAGLPSTALATVFKIGTYGDSITRGNGCPLTGSPRDATRQEDWNRARNEGVQITFVGSQFAPTLGTSPNGEHHDGLPGDTIAGITAGAPPTASQPLSSVLTTFAPDLAVLMSGTNDAQVGTSVPQVIIDYNAQLDTFRAYSQTLDLIAIVPIPLLSPQGLANLAAIQAAERTIIQDRIAAGDRHLYFGDASNYPTSAAFYANGGLDQFHPSCSGYIYLGDNYYWPLMRLTSVLLPSISTNYQKAQRSSTSATAIMSAGM